ncbi:MAG: InlB B-repeat-containing protein [Clostridia bacterium]|nr:InlB B-repeat-containing protein [Clostridia bacterium]
MKKIALKLIAFILILATFLTCVACADPVSVHINLNHSKADYTNEYRKANGNFTSKNLSKIVGNKKMTELPTENDLIAPSGQIFAGWYFDADGTADNIYNQENWETHFSDKKGATVYAKWIENNKTLFVFDANIEGDFTTEFKTANQISGKVYQRIVDTANLTTYFSSFPNENDLIVPSGKTFAGWYLDRNYQKPLNLQNFYAEYSTNKGYYTLYPKFENLPTVRLIYCWDGFSIIESVAKEHYGAIGYNNVSLVTIDDGNTYQVALSNLPKEEYFNRFNYVFDGWYLDGEYTMEFNETNYKLAVIQARAGATYHEIDINIYLKAHWQD